MAKQIEGVYERVYACAKKEFLKNGFKDASLRVIAQEAGTSTGSIYTRFKDKEGLFQAIVEPVVEEMKLLFLSVLDRFEQIGDEQKEDLMPEYSGKGMKEVLDFMYEHFEEFQLLLDASYGTRFQNFLDELVEMEVASTYKYMEAIGCESVKSGMVTEDFIHIVTSAYFTGVFEVIRHNMDKADALRYMNMLSKYHMAGFDTIFSPEKYEIYSPT